MAASRVLLGRVVGAHGVGGELRIAWLGDGPENLLRATSLWLSPARNAPERARAFEVLGFGSASGRDLRVRLHGVDDREAAEALKGQSVFGDARRLERLGEGEFYWHQLIGCRVETPDGRVVGTVRELWETGAHDVLVVECDDGDRLIPTAREILTEIDIEARRAVVEPIPGLLDPPDGAASDEGDGRGGPQGSESDRPRGR